MKKKPAKEKPWYKKWWVYILATLCLLFILLVVPLIINESYKCGGYITEWGAADVLSFYGSILTLFGTLLIGLIAIHISAKANSMNSILTDLQIKDRKAFITIDDKKGVKIYYKNTDPLFINKIDNANLNLEAYFTQNKYTNDLIIIEFYIKNITNNYITKIILSKLKFTPDATREGQQSWAEAIECDGSNSSLLQSNGSRKVVLVVYGFNEYLQKLKTFPQDFIGDACDLDMIFDVENLVREKTTIETSLFLEKATTDEKIKQTSYKISFNEFITNN